MFSRLKMLNKHYISMEPSLEKKSWLCDYIPSAINNNCLNPLTRGNSCGNLKLKISENSWLMMILSRKLQIYKTQMVGIEQHGRYHWVNIKWIIPAIENFCSLSLHKGYFKLDFFIHHEELCMETDKGLISNIYKQLMQLNIKKTNNPIKKMGRRSK